MKTKIAIIILCVSFSIFIALGTLFAYKFYQFAKTFQVPVEKNTSRYQVVYTCQYLSSQAINEGWDYGACLTNLEEALEKDVLLKVRI